MILIRIVYAIYSFDLILNCIIINLTYVIYRYEIQLHFNKDDSCNIINIKIKYI